VTHPSERAPGLVVPADSALSEALVELAREARLVFFAGLPGTGKSLLIHQLAHLAHARGRRVRLLQWDVARPVFEASLPGRRYPMERGVTHGVIRLAVGRWARRAVGRWHEAHREAADLLVGETPLIGHRFVELARRETDAVEPILAARTTRFVIPVPSPEVRRHLETERARRAGAPVHDREREDAPPEVLRDLWRELVSAAQALGIAASPAGRGSEPAWDPTVYARVYQSVLVHRRAQELALDTVLPTGGFSPYDFQIPYEDLLPAPEEVERFIAEAARLCPDDGAVRRALERWYRVG
jgi:hypothetical protein